MDVLEQIESEIKQVSTNGAYDQGHCYDTITKRHAKPIIPLRKDAVIC